MEVTEVGDRSVIVHRLTCVGDGSLLPILCEAIERNQLGVGLKVRTQSVPGGKLRAGKYTLRTGKAGRATFSLKPKARAFGKKLTTKASGSNALGKAQMKKSTKLPRRGGRH